MLAGRTILIVDAEYLIALDIEQRLENLNAGKVVIATSPASALERAEEWAGCALAIIEIEEDFSSSIALAQTIMRSGTPVIGITADGRLGDGMARLEGVPMLIKPLGEKSLAEAAKDLLSLAR